MKSGIKPLQTGLRGTINRFLAGNVETLLKIAGKKHYKKFVTSTFDVKATQAEVLREIMGFAKDTAFGKDHNLASVTSWEDYKNQVPTRDYEGHRPYVDRHAKGEADVLFPGKPLMYTRSSGTTALPKLIPISPYNFERSINSRSKLWLYGLLREHPGAFKGHDLSLVSPAVEGHTEDGTPYGSLSGLVYKSIPEFMKQVHSIPEEANDISDYNSKVYTLMRFALPQNISILMTGNPATVLNLVTRTDFWKEDLIRDIREGTLKADLKLEPELRTQLEALLEPAPERARLLEQQVESRGTLHPADYWPNLRLLHTWKNGNCRLMLPKLKDWFSPETAIVDFGYIASELTATDLIQTDTDGSILQVRNGFYEFTKYVNGEEDLDRFYLAHELEVGQQYYIYITTFSGLYRYDMNDVVKVIGHFNQAPVLTFSFKGKGVTSMQGEKLSEEQFIDALRQTAGKTEMEHDFFIGYADTEDSRYRLYIEFNEEYTESQIQNFEKTMDKVLSEVNIEYEAKLKTDRLAPLKIVQLGKNSFDKYRAIRLSEGALDGQLKWMNLSGTKATKERMAQLSANK